MGRKYYCDYCDKSFADNPTNRRNHFRGVHHQRMVKQHYDRFKDPIKRYEEERRKLPCRSFFSPQGSCRFGDGCMYSHMTPEEKEELFLQAKANSSKKKSEPKFDEWLKTWQKMNESSEKSPPSTLHESAPDDIPEFTLPMSLRGFTNLPPSLLPPTREDMLSAKYEEWG